MGLMVIQVASEICGVDAKIRAAGTCAGKVKTEMRHLFFRALTQDVWLRTEILVRDCISIGRLISHPNICVPETQFSVP
jgi:hypothetical protein